MKPVFWIIKSNRFGSVLGNDGKFYNMTAIENIKKYKTEGFATRRLIRLNGEFTAHALYEGDILDCCGKIERKK